MAQCHNFPRTDVPTNALQGQIVQYSKTLPKKKKNPTLQASVGMLKVKAHDCPIKNKPGLFGRASKVQLLENCPLDRLTGRPKQRCLAIIHNTTLQHVRTNTLYEMSSTVAER